MFCRAYNSGKSAPVVCQKVSVHS